MLRVRGVCIASFSKRRILLRTCSSSSSSKAEKPKPRTALLLTIASLFIGGVGGKLAYDMNPLFHTFVDENVNTLRNVLPSSLSGKKNSSAILPDEKAQSILSIHHQDDKQAMNGTTHEEESEEERTVPVVRHEEEPPSSSFPSDPFAEAAASAGLLSPSSSSSNEEEKEKEGMLPTEMKSTGVHLRSVPSEDAAAALLHSSSSSSAEHSHEREEGKEEGVIIEADELASRYRTLMAQQRAELEVEAERVKLRLLTELHDEAHRKHEAEVVRFELQLREALDAQAKSLKAKSEEELAQQTAAIHAELEDQMNHEIALMREKHVKGEGIY